nr:CsbD family protein [Kitasatospora sp. MBT66]
MSVGDKIENTAEKAKGVLKEGVGKVTGNERLEAEGRADQAGADVKQAGEKVKDAFKH